MFRLQCFQMIKHWNRLQSIVIKSHFEKPMVFTINNFSSDIKFGNDLNTYTENDTNLMKYKRVANNLADIRDKRLNQMKRHNPEGDYDILTESLIKSKTIDETLELVSSHHKVMNNRHLSETFESLHDIIRNSDDFREDSVRLLASPEFRLLCNRSMKRIRYFQPSEILNSLKSLLYLKISPQTMIIQSLLQMARQVINDFSLEQIVFLDFLLTKRMDENINDLKISSLDEDFENFDTIRANLRDKQSIVPLVDAMKLALPLVLQVKIESKELDFDDIDLVIKCLRMGAKHNIKDEVINRLAAAVSVQLQQLTIHQMLSVIASLTNLHFPHSNVNSTLIDRVTKECLDKVSKPGVVLPQTTSLYFVISLITYSKDRHVHYHNGMFEMVANLIVNNADRVDIFRTVQALWALTKHGHVHYRLLDLVAEKVASNDRKLFGDQKVSFVNILKAFALPSDYNPNKNNSQDFYDNILTSNQIEFFRSRNRRLLFKILNSLSILNYYPHDFLNECVIRYLDDSIAVSTASGSRLDFLQTLLPIYQGLCLESTHPSHGDDCDLKHKIKPYIDEYISLQNTDSNNRTDSVCKSETLYRALSQGLGGIQFVANNKMNRYGHSFDHLICMRKGGYALPIGENSEFVTNVRDFNLPIDSKLIAIIPLTFRDFCRTPAILKRETEFRIRTIRKTGVIPIPINLESWDSLLEHERIPYIMREIQQSSLADVQQTNIY